MIAVPFSHAQIEFGDSRDRLGHKLAFVDAVVRYLVAVLATEYAGLEIEGDHPAGYQNLLDKLHQPTWGDWNRAGEDLARFLVKREADLVAPEFARFYFRPRRKKAPRRTEAGDALQRLITERTKVAHPESGSLVPDDAAASESLDRIREPLRAVQTGLRFLERYPLLYMEHLRRRQGRGRVAKFHRITGTDLDTRRIQTTRRIEVCEEVPFILHPEAGHALFLSPWVVFECFPGMVLRTATTLCKHKTGRFVYSNPQVRDAAPSSFNLANNLSGVSM